MRDVGDRTKAQFGKKKSMFTENGKRVVARLIRNAGGLVRWRCYFACALLQLSKALNVCTLVNAVIPYLESLVGMLSFICFWPCCRELHFRSNVRDHLFCMVTAL